jgi:hypothetical protein
VPLQIIKRLLIFVLLGPFLGLLIAFIGVSRIAPGFRGNITLPTLIQLGMIFVPYAYILGVGAIPAAACSWLSRRAA